MNLIKHIFVYGTLKQDFSNFHLNKLEFLGNAETKEKLTLINDLTTTDLKFLYND